MKFLKGFKKFIKYFEDKFRKNPFPYYFVLCSIITAILIKLVHIEYKQDDVLGYVVGELNSLPGKEKLNAMHNIFHERGYEVKSSNKVINYFVTYSGKVDYTNIENSKNYYYPLSASNSFLNRLNGTKKKREFIPYFQDQSFITQTSPGNYIVKPFSDTARYYSVGLQPNEEIYKSVYNSSVDINKPIFMKTDSLNSFFNVGINGINYFSTANVLFPKDQYEELRFFYNPQKQFLVKIRRFADDSNHIKIYRFRNNELEDSCLVPLDDMDIVYSDGDNILVKSETEDGYIVKKYRISSIFLQKELEDSILNDTILHRSDDDLDIFFTENYINIIHKNTSSIKKIFTYNKSTFNKDSLVIKENFKHIYQIAKYNTLTLFGTDNNNYYYVNEDKGKFKIQKLHFDQIKNIVGINLYDENKINLFYKYNDLLQCNSYIIELDSVIRTKSYYDTSLLSKLKDCDIYTPFFSTTPQLFISIFHGTAYASCIKNDKDDYLINFIYTEWPNQVKITKKIEYFNILFIVTILLTFYGIGFIYLTIRYPKNVITYNFEYENIKNLKVKLLEINNISDNLYIRSNVMLFVGLVLGIGGMLVSIFIFDSSYEKIKSFYDAQSVVRLLRNIMFLAFVETFAFFFLKQYRINYNEFKMFKSIFMRMVNYVQILELSQNEHMSNEKIIDLYANEKIDFFESNSKIKVDEFNDELMKKMIDIINKR